ncbi:hypothetical protein H0H87_011220 [Tephrocybe sp. NHM501043]|nr:hypothetical protein H0H87_011220 [Tephrocybe sp. NHM501043]
MGSTATSTGLFLHFDPNKLPPPPILGGPPPHHLLPSTPLPGSASYGAKRKRVDDMGASPSKTFSFEKAIERAARNEINYAVKQRLKTFENRDELMKALGQCFKESQIVDFAACYRAYDPGVSHKQRIQTITYEIWKTTGYRFTVKDHPRAKDGHKTRLWCSQDEAHKNKPSKASHAPRITSDGLVLAKARYPCRSGLLISSRDESEPNISHVVVRMHHHLAHEPYYDHTLPPEMTQSIWEKIPKAAVEVKAPNSSAPAMAHPSSASTIPIIAPPEVFMEDDEADIGPGPSDPNTSLADQTGSQSSQGIVDTPALHSPREPREVFQERMRKHIADIRDFCDGLEYQLQFNDFKLLEVLEREGSQFLKFVHHCLEMEGRLRDPGGPEEGST